jgi:hypothetical protein
MVAHHQAEAVTGLQAAADERRRDAVGVGVQAGVRAHLVRQRAVAEAPALEGEDIEVGLLLGADGDQVGQNHLGTFTHTHPP